MEACKVAIDQWIVRNLAKLIRHRYAAALGDELPRWHSITETERIKLMVSELAACGSDITIRPGVQIIAPEQVRFGSHIGIGNYSILRGNGGITFEDFVLLGDNVILATTSHPIGGLYFHQNWQQPITLKSNVWLGANAIVMPGVTIGENSIIGAGAVVTEDIPANSVAVGVPAKVVRTLDIDEVELNNQKKEVAAARLKKIQRPDTPDVYG
jgi:maltose O-acetyltransferase